MSWVDLLNSRVSAAPSSRSAATGGNLGPSFNVSDWQYTPTQIDANRGDQGNFETRESLNYSDRARELLQQAGYNLGGQGNFAAVYDPQTGGFYLRRKTGDGQSLDTFYERQGDQYVPVRQENRAWDTNASQRAFNQALLLAGGVTGANLYAAGAGAGAGGAAAGTAGGGAGGGTAAGTTAAGTSAGGAATGGAAGGAAGTAAGTGGVVNALLSPQGMQLGSTLLGMWAANDAGRRQEDAANRATDMQRDMFEQNRADMAPWREAGVESLGELRRLLGIGPNDGSADFGSLARDFSMADYQQDPGYQFRLQQGERAINNNALARGRYNSGSVLRALQGYNSDLASQEYGRAFDRYNANRDARFNSFASLAGLGQRSTAQTNAERLATGNMMGNNMMGGAASRGAGNMGMANAVAGGVGNWLDYSTGQQMVEAIRGAQGNGQWQRRVGNWRNPMPVGEEDGY